MFIGPTHRAAYLYIALHVFLGNIHHCHAASSEQRCQRIIWRTVQPRERERRDTSHLVFQLCTFLSPPRKHAPSFLLHDMFTRVDCLITAIGSTLYSDRISIPLLVHNDTDLQGCGFHVHIFSELSHMVYVDPPESDVEGYREKVHMLFR